MTRRARPTLFVMTGFWLLALALFPTTAARAQGETTDARAQAPPPMKLVPREDRPQLDAERDIKKRTQLSIRLAESHLTRAEQLTGAEKYDAVIGELGSYQGVVDDALKFLTALPAKKDKTRDNLKRLELALHPHVTRLETMRRETPASYGFNFKAMIEYVRDARDQALASFYDDPILRNLDAEAKETRPAQPRGDVENTFTPRKKPD